MLGGIVASLLDGARLAIQYNPIVAPVTAAVAAALSGYPRAPRERRWYSALVVALGWLVGDGLRILGRVRDALDGILVPASPEAPAQAVWATLAAWAALGLAVGYAVPACVGIATGRRVTHGTGWLAAASVAAGLSVAVSAIVGALS